MLTDIACTSVIVRNNWDFKLLMSVHDVVEIGALGGRGGRGGRERRVRYNLGHFLQMNNTI